MVRCDRCERTIRANRTDVRGAFGYDKLCPRCFGILVEDLGQKNLLEESKPTGLKRYMG